MNPQEVQTQSCLVSVSVGTDGQVSEATRGRLRFVTAPATPRPAATIILLRRGGRHSERAVEVLLVQRNPAARFMPGVWVFPGGVVEQSERAGDREGEPSDEDEERAHRAAAIRELEEEAGIALAPPHSPPRADGEETVDAGWFAPRRALDMHAAGELELVFPTIKHLESLLPYATSNEVLEAVGHRVEPVLPKVIGEGAEQRIVLPGDPGYET